jgi:hypothetical protein
MDDISSIVNKLASDEIATKQIYANYKKKKGKHSFEEFIKNLKKFYEFTYNAYIWGEYCETGPQSREEAYGLWVNYMGGLETEADRYFKSVDDFCAYS